MANGSGAYCCNISFHKLSSGTWVSVIILSEQFCVLQVFPSLKIGKKTTFLKPCFSFIKIAIAKRNKGRKSDGVT